MKLGKVK